MFCAHCGVQLRENANFCTRCGSGRAVPPTAGAGAQAAVAEVIPVRPLAPAGFVPLGRLAWWLVVLLVACAVVDGVAVLSTVSYVQELRRAPPGTPVADEDPSATDLRQMFVGLVQVILLLATALLFLRWMRRAYRNLRALSSRELSFAPGWAIGAWFVPFLNLVRPYQIIKETWWISCVPEEAERFGPGSVPYAPAVIKWWWGVYLLDNFLGQAVFRTSLNAKSISDLLLTNYLSIAADLIGFPSAWLAIRVVRLMSGCQESAAQGAGGAQNQTIG